MGAHLLKFSNWFTAYSFYPIELKLGRMVLDISLHNCYEQDFRGAGGCQNFRIFADVICTCFLVSPSQESLSLQSERWPQRPFGAIFSLVMYLSVCLVDNIEKEMRLLFNIHDDKDVRLWNKYMTNTYEHLDKPENTLQDAGLYQGQMIVIEQKNDDGSWPRQTKRSVAGCGAVYNCSVVVDWWETCICCHQLI